MESGCGSLSPTGSWQAGPYALCACSSSQTAEPDVPQTLQFFIGAEVLILLNVVNL